MDIYNTLSRTSHQINGTQNSNEHPVQLLVNALKDHIDAKIKVKEDIRYLGAMAGLGFGLVIQATNPQVGRINIVAAYAIGLVVGSNLMEFATNSLEKFKFVKEENLLGAALCLCIIVESCFLIYLLDKSMN